MIKPIKLDLILSIVIALIVFALFIPHAHHGLSLWDEGLNIYRVKRVYDGQVPSRDFHMAHGPARYYLQVLLFRALGVTVSTGKIYMILTLALASMTTYLLARQINIYVPLSILCSFLILHNSTSLLFLASFDRILWSFFSLLSIMNYLNKEKKRYLFLAGILGGFTFLIGQETGLCVMGASGITLILKRKFNRSPAFLMEFMVWGAGILCIIGPYLLHLIYNGAINNYFFDGFVRHRRYSYSSAFIGQRGISLTLKSFFRAAMHTDNLQAALYAHRFYGLIAVYLVILYYIFRARLSGTKISETYLKMLLLVSFGIFMFYLPLAAPFPYYILLVLPPGIILSAYLFQKLCSYQKTKFLHIFSIIVIIYLSVHYLCSLKAVVNILSSLNNCRHGWSINLKRAKISLPPPMEAGINLAFPFQKKEDFLALIDYIQSNTSADSKIFIASLDTMLYFLAERDNATKFDCVNETYLIPEDTISQREIIEDLKKNRAPYIIFSNVLSHGDKTSKQYIERLIPHVYDFIIKNYELQKSIGYFELWAPRKFVGNEASCRQE